MLAGRLPNLYINYLLKFNVIDGDFDDSLVRNELVSLEGSPVKK